MNREVVMSTAREISNICAEQVMNKVVDLLCTVEANTDLLAHASDLQPIIELWLLRYFEQMQMLGHDS